MLHIIRAAGQPALAFGQRFTGAAYSVRSRLSQLKFPDKGARLGGDVLSGLVNTV